MLLGFLFALLPLRLNLDGVWQLAQDSGGQVTRADVPGTVQSALLKAKQIPDPFGREAEKPILWIEDHSWTYTRSFTVGAELLERRHIVLRCEGLDTLADVSVNGQAAGHADNMFRTWEFDVKPFLKAGENRISVAFRPVGPYLAGRPTGGWGYLRKAPYQQGWDFAPQMVTYGIWRSIGLLGWDDGRLTDLSVVQHHGHGVSLDVKVAADASSPTSVRVRLSFKGRVVAEAVRPLVSGSADVPISVPHPQLWWPNGMGPQNLYDVSATLVGFAGRPMDVESRRIGLRTVTWFPKTTSSPLGLAVNGRRFYAKGSNWVPCEALLGRPVADKERRLVDLAVNAHMNLLRLWGGGYYESDDFLNACDEKGLLVWFEFKYADAAYPSFDSTWLANVKAETADNLRRVRNHPCIAIYSGNNEVVGFIADHTDSGHMSRDDYNLLFHKTLPDVVHELAPDAAYTPGSPEIGDDHDWDVWHGNASFSSYLDVHGFLSEFGFQSFPNPSTVDSFTSSSDRTSVESAPMRLHQRNWRDGNQLILSRLATRFRKPKDFDSTLWLSQILQADGVLTGVEHWRRDWPHSTGSLVWQFDDCWPAISWAMVDYYTRPKALYYGLARAYAPVSLSGLADGDTAKLWVASDLLRAAKGTLNWRFLKLDGTVVSQGSSSVSLAAGCSSVPVVSRPGGASDLLFWAELHVPGQPVSTTVLSFVRPKELALQDPQILASVRPAGSEFLVTLSCEKPALWAWVDLGGVDADYSDNFVDLRKGAPVTIRVRPWAGCSLGQFRKALRVRSLFDTYLPGEEAVPITRPGSDGTIVASAENAEILGDGAFVETGNPSNIGNWSLVTDRLRWTLDGVKPGSYRVSATVAIPDQEAGSTFDVSVGSSRLSGTVPGTGGWYTYRDISLGTVTVSSGGRLTITLTPTSKPHDHVMNLRHITLVPVGN